MPDSVALVDAGTIGNPLLTFIEATSRLLIIDAADFAYDPGTLFTRSGADIPRWLSSTRASLHQSSFAELLGLAALRSALPSELHLVGFQPVDISFGNSLSLQGRNALDAAAGLVLHKLRQWKLAPFPRNNPEPFQDRSVSLESYSRLSGCPF